MSVDLSLGSMLGDFRLERVAGRGGMGVVYEATELALSRRVALKVIASDLADDESFRQRFARELEYVVALEHPNVIPVYRAGEVDGVLFIAMRFVAGIDLRVLLSRHERLGPHDAVRVLSQVGAALDRAHAGGLVHRDVKPGNILLDGEDASAHVYLTDFGLVKHVTSAGGLTRPGALVGTPGYIAPEQVLGEPVDARTDVYSLACVLFEMLAGHPPYPRESEAAMLFAHVQEEPPSILEVAPDLNPGFEEVIARGMATAREDRYQSAGDLARAAALAAERRSIRVADESVATGAAAPKRIDTRLSALRWRSRAQQPGHRPASPPPAEPGAAPLKSEPPPPAAREPAATSAQPSAAAAGEHEPAARGKSEPPPRGAKSSAGGRDSSSQPPARGPAVSRKLALGVLIAIAAAAAIALIALTGGGEPQEGARQAAPPESGQTGIEVGRGPSDVVAGAGTIWVANRGGGTVSRLDEASGRTQGEPIAVGGNPSALAYADGILHVLDGRASRLTRIDAGSGRPVGRPTTHSGETLTAGFGSVWIVNGTSGDVERVDAATGRSTAEAIEVGSFPVDAVAGDSAVWVLNSDSGTLSRIDPATNETTGEDLRVGRGATDLAISGEAVWVANPATDQVLRVSTSDDAADVESIPVPGARAVAVAPNAVWVSSDEGVVRLDPRTGSVRGEPLEVADAGKVAATRSAAWVLRPEADEVVRLEP